MPLRSAARQGAAGYGLLTLTIALFMGSALGCGDEGDPSNLDDGVIVRGIVRDASDGSRIKSAKVTFRSDTRDEASDKTDDDGEFVITVFSRAENGRISASKSDYQTAVVSVYLDDNDVTIDVDLEPK